MSILCTCFLTEERKIRIAGTSRHCCRIKYNLKKCLKQQMMIVSIIVQNDFMNARSSPATPWSMESRGSWCAVQPRPPRHGAWDEDKISRFCLLSFLLFPWVSYLHMLLPSLLCITVSPIMIAFLLLWFGQMHPEFQTNISKIWVTYLLSPRYLAGAIIWKPNAWFNNTY